MSDETLKNQTGGFGRDKDVMGTESKFRSKRRRKVSYLTLNKIETVDYKDVPILRKFINDRGKILPSRQSGNTAKQQRMVSRAIRRARELALLPFVVGEMTPGSRDFGPRRDRSERPPREMHREVEAPVEREAPAAVEAEAPAVEAAAPAAE